MMLEQENTKSGTTVLLSGPRTVTCMERGGMLLLKFASVIINRQ